MIGYVANTRAGAITYNLVHTYAFAALITLYGLLAGHRIAISLSLILAAHIGLDRLLGYGLKYPTAFKETHIQRL